METAPPAETAVTVIDSHRDAPARTYLVSGAASGLGAAIAQRLRSAGVTPVGLDLAPCAGFDCEVVDVSDPDAVAGAVERVVRANGRLDGVVTAAGIDVCGRLDSVDAHKWERVIAVNLLGTANVVRAALPALIESRGRVMTIASTLGHRAVSDATAYCASKFGVVGFTRALMAELKGSGVSVTLVTPGGMRTPFFDGREEQYRPGPDAPLLPPEDVAFVIASHLIAEAPVVRELVLASPEETCWP